MLFLNIEIFLFTCSLFVFDEMLAFLHFFSTKWIHIPHHALVRKFGLEYVAPSKFTYNSLN